MMATFKISYIRECKKKIMVIDEGRGLHGCKDFVSTSYKRNGNKPELENRRPLSSETGGTGVLHPRVPDLGKSPSIGILRWTYVSIAQSRICQKK